MKKIKTTPAKPKTTKPKTTKLKTTKPKTTKLKTLPKNHIILSGEAGKLLKKGSILKQQLKDAEDELKETKIKLIEYITSPKGTYLTTDEKIRLVIGETKVYSEIDSHLLFKYMKKEGMLKHFWICVKAQLTTIKKHVPETRIDKWRKELDPNSRWTWK